MEERGWRAPVLAVVAIGALLVAGCTSESSSPTPTSRPAAGPTTTAGGAAFREPVRLSSKDGVLEVTLRAHQSTITLDTVAKPVTNALVYGYTLQKGTASDGSTSGDGLYPGPTLRVDPGQRLIIHLQNDLYGLTADDFYDPTLVKADEQVPKYRPPLKESPLNLHTHGLHVSPDGNEDNILLDIPAGLGNTYDYAVPNDMPHGMYWYHSHRHIVSAEQTYMGLAGLLEIGRPDGNLPAVTQNNLPIRNMALQYNFVFDRQHGGAQLNQPNWPQFVSTLTPPEGNELTDGTYQPRLSPTNFGSAPKGTQYFTNWYSGPLSPQNHRGQNQFFPSNLLSFTGSGTAGASAPSGTGTSGPSTVPSSASPPATAAGAPVSVPANPSLPDSQRDVQYTVNGQFQPTIATKPGQTEIWVLANVSDFAYNYVTLTETATGMHPKIAIVGQDGNPFPAVSNPTTDGGTTLVVPPGSRYAIAVTMPQTGDLILEMPAKAGAKAVKDAAVLYTNDGTDRQPATLGEVTTDPTKISYFDGFFTFPTQVLAKAHPEGAPGTTVPFAEGQKLDAYTSFVPTQDVTPDVTRTLKITGGFDNEKASKSDPLAFDYIFNANLFPNVALIQPRLDSVEEWTVENYNNDDHPIHIHVNDFQMMKIVDPAGATTGVQMWGEDNVNAPAALTDENENPLAPSVITLRTKFLQYTGTYVIHCHRLNHEDQGLMAIVNVIPAVSSYAVATPGSPGVAATVQLYDGNGNKPMRTVTPFPGFEGTPTVAMGDVDGDSVLDLVAGTGEGAAAEVVAYSGKAAAGGAVFEKEIVRFKPFAPDFRGGANVATGDIDGNGHADNIIVGSGPGMPSTVKVYSSKLPATAGTVPEEFTTISPSSDQAGVTVATGLVDMHSGRTSIVTAPGPGVPARVKTFRFDLFTVNPTQPGVTNPHAGHDPKKPAMTSDFLAFDESYTGGVSLSTGWVAGAQGGAKSIIAGQLAGGGGVKVFSSGNALDGAPDVYTQDLNEHTDKVAFREIASFNPFGSATGAVRVATTSTTTGADLLVGGPSAAGGAEVRRYTLLRDGQTGTTITPSAPTTVTSVPGAALALGGQ